MVAGAMVTTTSGSCVLADKCIHTTKPGHRWIGHVVGTFYDPVLEETKLIHGEIAKCYDYTEHATLAGGNENNQLFVLLKSELLTAAGLKCVELLPANALDPKCNPLDEELGLTSYISATPSVPCYLNDYGMDDDPSCPEGGGEEGTSAGVGGEEGGEPTTGPDPCQSLDLANRISCSGNTCQVSQDLIDDIFANPSLLLTCDTARLHPKVVSGNVIGMYFDGVWGPGLAGMLGFQEDDVIIAVEGLPFKTEDDFVAIALEIAEADEITVTIQRGSTVVARIYERD